MAKKRQPKRTNPGRPPFDPSLIEPDADAPLFAQPTDAANPSNPARPPTDSPANPGSPAANWNPALEPANPPRFLTVSDLNRLVRGALKSAFPADLHVIGELSNIARPAGGHLYFTLKDDAAEVRCVMWRSSAQSLKFDLKDGMEIVATGAVDLYEPRGQFQFYVRRMDPRGVGALELAFRQLKEKLEKEGLFDPRRKRPLPRFPRRIAIITSPTGAAVRDILQTIRRRYPCVHLLVFGVRVQGEGAAAEIADALHRVNRSSDALGGIDLLILARGGGSIEDLWAFNEEPVARAIHASAIPIISAVGHETDFTIADFVADARAATPTAAAELVAPVLSDLLAELELTSHRLTRAARSLLENLAARLRSIERSEWLRDPLTQIARCGQRLDEALGRLRLALSHALAARKSTLHALEIRLARLRPEAVLARRRELLTSAEHRLVLAQSRYNLHAERRSAALAARLQAAAPIRTIAPRRVLLSQLEKRLATATSAGLNDRTRTIAACESRLVAGNPEQVLARGFSITRRARDRRIITNPNQVQPGDAISTQTREGEFDSQIRQPDAPKKPPPDPD